MKKIFLFLTIICMCTYLFAQKENYKVVGNQVVVEKIFQTDLSIEQAHDAIEAYLASAYNNSNYTNKLNNPNHLIYTGIFGEIETFSLGAFTIDVHHNLDIAFKDGRVKVKIYIDVADVRNSSSNRNTFKNSYYITEYVPVTDKYNMMELNAPKKSIIAAFDKSISYMNIIVSGAEQALIKSSNEDEW
ncbi:MAG: hypothetical protein IKN91_06605 [Paludibacteraceae bacterium]|nr:hypothetical protein [Paludibacteraceae bacterium]